MGHGCYGALIVKATDKKFFLYKICRKAILKTSLRENITFLEKIIKNQEFKTKGHEIYERL